MKICVHDFAGHPFQAQLSRALARRGHDVLHAYCGGVTTGRGDLRRRADDPATLRFVDVSDVPFERYSPLRRMRSESRYGRRAARVVRRYRPQVVLSANTPLVAQALLWRECRRIGIGRVYWLQDFLGHGTRRMLAQRSVLLGATAGAGLERLETRLLTQSDAVVVIAEDFTEELRRRRVPTPVTVIENWAPLDEVPVRPKDNPWSRAHGYADVPIALYSGTLGLKHEPEHLVVAAQRLPPRCRLVVLTEGLGRAHLERRKEELGLDALDLHDYVDYDVLPDVLGAADVCLVLLERDAGAFSVPSKVLTYLAAGRAVVGAVPGINLAARTIARAEAGLTVDPGHVEQFAAAVADVLAAPGLAATLGDNGRRYAEHAFDIDAIAGRMSELLERAVHG